MKNSEYDLNKEYWFGKEYGQNYCAATSLRKGDLVRLADFVEDAWSKNKTWVSYNRETIELQWMINLADLLTSQTQWEDLFGVPLMLLDYNVQDMGEHTNRISGVKTPRVYHYFTVLFGEHEVELQLKVFNAKKWGRIEDDFLTKFSKQD